MAEAEKMDPKTDNPYPWTGDNKIFDEKERDDDAKNLNKGKYKMLSCSFDVLIDKREGLKLDSYDHLRNFRHDNAVPLLDFYLQDGKFGRLVIPKLGSSFQTWFDKGGKSLLFDERGHMTAMFEKLIIEYCDVVESLLELNLILENFDMDKMYVNVFDGVPTLNVLITEVKKVRPIDVVQRKLAWDCPCKFISWCEDQCNITRDSLTESFCAFLGKSSCNVAKLRKYPHNWDDSMKGEYLMSLVASDHSEMRYLLRGSGLTWPFTENLPCRFDNLPELLRYILDWDVERKREHNMSDFFSYVILLRNCYKNHEDLPKKIKDILINRRALIAHIEIWTPDFWIKVYEIIGWPSSSGLFIL